MPVLTIGDKSVTVGDEFLKLSPDQQNATVQEIAGSIGVTGNAAAAPEAPAAAPAPDIGENRQSAIAALRGIPIVGAYVDKGTAMLNAAAQPITETGLSHAGTYGERVAENEKLIKEATDAYEASHPIGTTVGKVALGTAAMVPAMAAAPEAFGLTGASLAARAGAGAASGGLLGGVDAAARGEDIGKGALTNAIVGGAGPAIGKAVGAGVEALANSGAQTPATNALAQAAERLGVDFPKVAASDSLITQRTGAALKELPVLGDPIVQASRKANEQMGAALKNVEQGYGSGSALNAGDIAKTAMEDWITGKSGDVASRLYGNVEALTNPAVTRDLTATRKVVADVLADRQNAALPGSSKAVDAVIDAVQNRGGLNYDGVKTLRTSIGEMLDSSVLPADIRKSELKRIYGALSTDLKDTVHAAGGPDALNAFNKANTINVLVNQRREALAKIIGTQANAAPEQVMDRLIGFAGSNARADFQKLALARKTIGAKGWDEVASSAVAKIGRDADGNFSPDRFLTAYGKLSPAGKQTLFSSTGKGDLAAALEDIATLSRKAKELSSYGNPSGTGRVLGGASSIGAIVSQPHIAIPGLLAARVSASRLAQSIRPKATTVQLAQRNAAIAALLDHVTTMVSQGVGRGIADQSNSSQRISQPVPLPLR